jgi:hypothetical protein
MVIKQLLPTKELEQVPLPIGVTINGLSTKIALLRVALEASTND